MQKIINTQDFPQPMRAFTECCVRYLARLSVRLRAVWCCMWFGLMPWQLYERQCHYVGLSYIQHVMLNVELAVIWLTGKELSSDWEFENKTNPSWSKVIRNMFCFPKQR